MSSDNVATNDVIHSSGLDGGSEGESYFHFKICNKEISECGIIGINCFFIRDICRILKVTHENCNKDSYLSIDLNSHKFVIYVDGIKPFK